MRNSKKKRVSSTTGFLLLATFCTMATSLLFLFILAGHIYSYQDTVDGVHFPDVDAIVCLAGGRGRISTAADVWYHYWDQAHRPEAEDDPKKLPILYLSGVGKQGHWGLISKQIRRGVLAVLSQEQVLIENESSNTETNVQWITRYAKQFRWKRILLLTSNYHMKRAKFMLEYILQQEQYPLSIETFSVYQEPFASEEWHTDPNGIRVTFLEYLKLLYYEILWKNLH